MCPCSQSWLDVLRRKTLKAKSALGHAAHAASSALGDIVGFAKPSHAAPLRLLTGQSHYAPNAVVAVKVGTLWLLHALVIELLAQSCMLCAGRHRSERRPQMLWEQQNVAGHSSEEF